MAGLTLGTPGVLRIVRNSTLHTDKCPCNVNRFTLHGHLLVCNVELRTLHNNPGGPPAHRAEPLISLVFSNGFRFASVGAQGRGAPWGEPRPRRSTCLDYTKKQ